MISYYPGQVLVNQPWAYANGFKVIDTQDVQRISIGISKYVCSGNAWRDGRRLKENFLYSDWAVLDFDEDNEVNLEQAINNVFVDMIHIIGTTKSHQIEKKGQPPCDRFRVLLPWKERIENSRVYRWNMELLAKKYPIDLKALDAAHYFFPCQEIKSISAEGYSLDVDPNVPMDFDSPIDPKEYRLYLEEKAKRFAITQRLPPWVEDFLDYGKLIQKSRNVSCYVSALNLFECGYSFEEVVQALNRAPFDRTKKWHDKELNRAVHSAYCRILKQGGFRCERTSGAERKSNNN